MKKLNLLTLPKNTPIFDQLQIEEALLRTSNENWLILNWGSSPAIVMGISAKVEEVVDLEKHAQQSIPLIRRYSGGGTVVVDQNTLFISWILQKEENLCRPFPKSIMEWSIQFLPFELRENDYVIKNKKVGGNAQSIVKEAFVHHTSFLWDYDANRMDLLKMPPKMPDYRKNRGHEEFITSLKAFFPSPEIFFEDFLNKVSLSFSTQNISIPLIESFLSKSHRKSTKFENPLLLIK